MTKELTNEAKANCDAEPLDFVHIYIMGKKYAVPSTLTIMKAFEYVGYTLIRGCGCRAGFCGACSTVYRLGKDHELKVGLSCQTKVEDNMYLAQIPFYPVHDVRYSLDKLEADTEQLVEVYPEITKCLGCNACSRVCPQEIKVMKYIAHSIRGEISKAANESFDCLMCGLCATKCPANLVQYRVALLSRRLHSKYLAPRAAHLASRLAEMEAHCYDAELDFLVAAEKSVLVERYNKREIK